MYNRRNLFDGYRVIDMDIREQERHEEKDNHKELRIFEYKDIRSSTTGHKGGRAMCGYTRSSGLGGGGGIKITGNMLNNDQQIYGKK